MPLLVDRRINGRTDTTSLIPRFIVACGHRAAGGMPTSSSP